MVIIKSNRKIFLIFFHIVNSLLFVIMSEVYIDDLKHLEGS